MEPLLLLFRSAAGVAAAVWRVQLPVPFPVESAPFPSFPTPYASSLTPLIDGRLASLSPLVRIARIVRSAPCTETFVAVTDRVRSEAIDQSIRQDGPDHKNGRTIGKAVVARSEVLERLRRFDSLLVRLGWSLRGF